jgi:hypothetical protein
VHTQHNRALDLRRRGLIVAAFAAAFATANLGGFAYASSPLPASTAALQLAQAGAEDDNPPPSDQVDKYIAVYTAMQRDHNLTVEQAARKQGLTVAQFRSIEDRIERNPVVHDRVLQALKDASKKAKAPAGKTP